MIDKLDLRVPSMAEFSSEFSPIAANLRLGPVEPFRPARFYRLVGDLRKRYGIDAVLHLEYKLGECTHKVEIVDMGKKTVREAAQIVTRIFDVDPNALELMRLDLAADVGGVPVTWFRANARFSYKRFASNIDKAKETELEFIAMSDAVSQSLYAGRRPNCMRIYDKVAEWRKQWRKIKRDCERFNEGMNKLDITPEQKNCALRVPPTFQEFCTAEGFEYSEGVVLTRVERQIGGDKFPNELRTLSDLKRLSEFNPFSAFQIIGHTSGSQLPPPDSMSVRDWLELRGYLALVDDVGGAQNAGAFIQRHAKGNGRRVLESLKRGLRAELPISEKRILEIFRNSVLKQISTNPTDRIYLAPTYDKANEIAESGARVFPQAWEGGRRETGGQIDCA